MGKTVTELRRAHQDKQCGWWQIAAAICRPIQRSVLPYTIPLPPLPWGWVLGVAVAEGLPFRDWWIAVRRQPFWHAFDRFGEAGTD
jgi:hypothetical protein